MFTAPRTFKLKYFKTDPVAKYYNTKTGAGMQVKTEAVVALASLFMC
jgi:hypothetical protein